MVIVDDNTATIHLGALGALWGVLCSCIDCAGDSEGRLKIHRNDDENLQNFLTSCGVSTTHTPAASQEIRLEFVFEFWTYIVLECLTGGALRFCSSGSDGGGRLGRVRSKRLDLPTPQTNRAAQVWLDASLSPV
eukprot:g74156.t1